MHETLPIHTPKFIGAASVTFTLVMALAGCGKVKDALQSPTASSPTPALVHLTDAQQGTIYQQQGIIAKQDYLHLVKIQDGIDKTQKVPDEDIAFITHELNTLPVQNTSKNAVQAQHLVLDHTYASPGHKSKRLTPSQRSLLYNAILAYTSSSDQWVQVDASLALAGTRDPRAIPVLKHMAQSSPYSVVRLDAATWLKALQKAGVTSGKAHL